MKRIKILSGKYGIHAFLLPAFFVLHSYVQYYGLASPAAALDVLVETEFYFVLFFFISVLFTKSFQRSAQLTTLIGFVILFYGVIKDFFHGTAIFFFLSRYAVLVPLMIIVIVLAIRTIRKKNDFSRPNRFMNTLLLLFLFVEAITLVGSNAEMFMQRNRLVKNNMLNVGSLPVSVNRPDVYFLVFDSYPGSGFLHDYLKYDNSSFDAALRNKGFYVAGHPQSNYNRTALSIASTLNFEYLQNMPDQSRIEPRQYNQASLSIEHAVVPAVFIHNGYQLYNLSVFGIAGHPALHKEDFLVLPEKRMLLYNTFFERFRHDVLWNFPLLKFGRLQMSEKQQRDFWNLLEEVSVEKRNFNNRAIDSLLKIPLQDTTKPKFIYAHFYLPHPPFFYDKNGKLINIDVVNLEKTMEDRTSFLSYLEYTNKIILTICDVLLQHSPHPPVIIIQSDHGYRDFRKDFISPAQYFKNYSAFYFPDKNYSTLYDTISNINTFPVIFNKYFNTHIPLQNDFRVFTVY